MIKNENRQDKQINKKWAFFFRHRSDEERQKQADAARYDAVDEVGKKTVAKRCQFVLYGYFLRGGYFYGFHCVSVLYYSDEAISRFWGNIKKKYGQNKQKQKKKMIFIQNACHIQKKTIFAFGISTTKTKQTYG